MGFCSDAGDREVLKMVREDATVGRDEAIEVIEQVSDENTRYLGKNALVKSGWY